MRPIGGPRKTTIAMIFHFAGDEIGQVDGRVERLPGFAVVYRGHLNGGKGRSQTTEIGTGEGLAAKEFLLRIEIENDQA